MAELRSDRSKRNHERKPIDRRRLEAVSAIEPSSGIVSCVNQHGSDPDLVGGGERAPKRVTK